MLRLTGAWRHLLAGIWQKTPRLTRTSRSIVMLYSIIVVLVLLWLAGFLFHVAGGLIHILLVIAVVVFIFQMLTGRRGGV